MEITSETISRWLKASTMPIMERMTRQTPPINPYLIPGNRFMHASFPSP